MADFWREFNDYLSRFAGAFDTFWWEKASDVALEELEPLLREFAAEASALAGQGEYARVEFAGVGDYGGVTGIDFKLVYVSCVAPGAFKGVLHVDVYRDTQTIQYEWEDEEVIDPEEYGLG